MVACLRAHWRAIALQALSRAGKSGTNACFGELARRGGQRKNQHAPDTMPGHVVRLNANVCGTRWPRRAAREPDTNYDGNADAAVARPTRRSHRPDGGSGAYNQTQCSTLPRSSFLCHAEMTVAGVKADSNRGCRGGQTECWTLQLPPAAAPRKEGKWPACVGAGRGCRGGRREAGPDKPRPLPRLPQGMACWRRSEFLGELLTRAPDPPTLFSLFASGVDSRPDKSKNRLGPRPSGLGSGGETRWSTLQRAATHCKCMHKLHVCLHVHACMLVRIIHMQRTATTATHCNALQHTATHRNTLQLVRLFT